MHSRVKMFHLIGPKRSIKIFKILKEKLNKNLPYILGLTRIWNRNILEFPSLGIIPYGESLKFFHPWVQQVEMESNGKNVEKTEKDLKAVFSKETWNARHLQIIFFGREHCPARFHDLENCLICSWAATKKRIQEEKK